MSSVVTLELSVRSDEDANTAASLREAEHLLSAMAAVRRTTRRTEGRPAMLASFTDSQFELVKLVSRHPGVSVAEAAETLRLAANTVSTLVGQLTEIGVMVRRQDAGDRRVAQLYLEEAMDRRVSDWHDRRVDVVASAINRLSPQDQHLLVRATPALGRLADAIDAAREA